MNQFKLFFREHMQSFSGNKRQIVILLILLPLVVLGVFLALQQTVLKPKAGGGNTHALKISLAAGAKTELAPNETTKVLVTSDMGSENILGFDVVLNYDSQMFDISELKPGQIFDSTAGGKGTVTVKSTDSGQIKLSWAAFNQTTKQFINNMSGAYGASSANVELLNVTLKAKANASGNSQIGFGETSGNIIVTVEGGGNKATISSQRLLDLEVNQGGVSNSSGAQLSMNPASATVNRNCLSSTEIKLNTGGHQTDGTDVLVNFDPAKIQGIILKKGSLYPEYLYATINNSEGQIKIAAVASPTQSYSGEGVYATFYYRVKADAPLGSSILKFDFDSNNKTKTTDSNVVEKDTASDVLASVTDGNYTIGEGSCGQDPQKPIVFAACANNSPVLNILWSGTVGKGVDADPANAGKNGFYVDISESANFDLVYNKFVEGSVFNTSAPSGFVLSNAGLSNTGSALNITSGKSYYVRIYNGTHSPVSDVTVTPSC